MNYLSSIITTKQYYNFIGLLWAYTLLPKMPNYTRGHTNIHMQAHTLTHTNVRIHALTHIHTLAYALAHKLTKTQIPMHAI